MECCFRVRRGAGWGGRRGPLLLLAAVGCGETTQPTVDADTEALALTAVFELGLAYAGSSINVSVFRHQSMLRLAGDDHAVAYYDEKGDVRIATIGHHGETKKAVRVTPRISRQLLGDGHASISLGMSPDRRLHVIYGAHATVPYYASFDEILLSEDSDSSEVAADPWYRPITYPQFYTLGTQLELWFRADPESAVHRVSYDSGSKSFPGSSEPVLVPGDADRVYMNSLAILGPRISLSWMYRLFSDDDVVLNEGLYVASSATFGRAWTARDGTALHLPVSRGVVPALVPLPSSARPLNQTTSTYGPDGQLYITYYSRDSEARHQIFLATVPIDGGPVKTETVSTNTTEYDLAGRGTLVLPLSRPQVAVSDHWEHVMYRQDDEIVIATKKADQESDHWRYLRTYVAGLGAWEPAYSLETWLLEERLVVFVQPARQGLLDSDAPGAPTLARLFIFE